MDIDLRIVLLLLGIVVIGVIVWDAYRKKRTAEEKSVEFNQVTLDEMMETRDFSGFDLTGVGTSRVVDDDSEIIVEPMVALRDEDIPLSEDTFENDGLGLEQSNNSEQPKVATEAVPEPEPELIITISILARSETGFIPDKLLHCMLSRGLRFGEMNIFHRHKNTSGEGAIQFSLANAVKPGTFDLDDMNSFQTKGITLFMMLPGPQKPQKSYQIMLDTAQHIAAELNGQLVDGARNVLTQQSIQHLNDKIQEFERKNIAKR